MIKKIVRHLFIWLLVLLTVKCSPSNQTEKVDNKKVVTQQQQQQPQQQQPQQQKPQQQKQQQQPVEVGTRINTGLPITTGRPRTPMKFNPIQELSFDNNVLTLTKKNTRDIFQDESNQSLYTQYVRDANITLFAVPSKNFEELMNTIRHDKTILNLHTGKKVSLGYDLKNRDLLLDDLNTKEPYSNYGMFYIVSNNLGDFIENDQQAYITINLEEKKSQKGITDGNYDSTDFDIHFLSTDYMNNNEWSKKWLDPDDSEYKRFLPQPLKYLISQAKVGDTYKTFFIILVSTKENDGNWSPMPYTSYTAYVSGLDDPNNTYLVKEFTIVD